MGTGKNSINRNILECKVREDEKRRIHKTVLIETYWNVKEEMGCKAILIATY